MISDRLAPPFRRSRSRTLAVLLPSRAFRAVFAWRLWARGALLGGGGLLPALPLPDAIRASVPQRWPSWVLSAPSRAGYRFVLFGFSDLCSHFRLFSFRGFGRDQDIHHSVPDTCKSIPRDSGRIFRGRKRALESPGRAWSNGWWWPPSYGQELLARGGSAHRGRGRAKHEHDAASGD